MDDRFATLFPHEMEALLAALRRDAREQCRKAETPSEDAQYHLANYRLLVRILEMLNPRDLRQPQAARETRAYA